MSSTQKSITKTCKYVEHNLKTGKLWETPHKTLEHAHVIKSKQRSFTACYHLPINTTAVTNICMNGIAVYDFCGFPQRTAVIGGGGRFEMKRRYYDGLLVSVELLLKDICYYTKKKPVFRVVIEVEEEGEA